MLSILRYCFLKALLCYIVALLHTTSRKFWCLSRLLFITKYYQQHFYQHRRQAKCTAVPLQIVELSQGHATWLLVDTNMEVGSEHFNAISNYTTNFSKVASLSKITTQQQISTHKSIKLCNLQLPLFSNVFILQHVLNEMASFKNFCERHTKLLKLRIGCKKSAYLTKPCNLALSKIGNFLYPMFPVRNQPIFPLCLVNFKHSFKINACFN